MEKARQFLHAFLVYCSAVPWFFGCLLFGVALVFTLLADKTIPESEYGNCWAFVGPKWFMRGGYLLVRASDDIRFLKYGIIPHVIWVKHLGENNTLIQTAPEANRSKNKWFPWRALYFKYKVLTTEKSRDAKQDETS